jgi:glycosyltransferase involved in cell wall biosynthesis
VNTLRCLWVTRLAPFPPFFGGDAIYSRRLIESLSSAGASVTVLCHDPDGGRPADTPSTVWSTVPFRDRGRVRSLVGRRPAIVHRFSTPEIRAALSALVGKQQWDAVMIDGLAMAGILEGQSGASLRSGTATLVYVSTNHESSLRRQLADQAPALSPYRLALRLDAAKARSYENALVSSVDLVTVTTTTDARLFRDLNPQLRTLVLPPGYDGSGVRHRMIDRLTPRRVLVLGSYAWVAKQLNILRFLRAAVGPLATAGIGIDVVGSIPDEFAARLRNEFPTVNVTGVVSDLRPYFARARIGIVAEEIGGGFKLKALDYVFNRLPVAALAGSVEGTPLRAGVSMLEFPDTVRLVEGIQQSIDDVQGLNAIQETAFAVCKGRFNWGDRGRRLAEELRQAHA